MSYQYALEILADEGIRQRVSERYQRRCCGFFHRFDQKPTFLACYRDERTDLQADERGKIRGIEYENNAFSLLFRRKGKDAFEHGKMSLSLFKYSTGICGMTLKNARGYITVLPFKGFQVWRACFDEHELVMKTLFDEPTQSTEYCKTYGAFLIHCGLTATGNPRCCRGRYAPASRGTAQYRLRQGVGCLRRGRKGRYVELCGSCRYVFGF